MEPFNFTTFQPSNNQYILVIGGKPQGPFTIEQLREHKIKPGDFLKTAAMDDYKEAHEIPELRELFGFSKQALIPQYFGNFDQRLMAAALDWFFVSGVCTIITFFVVIFINDRATRLIVTFSLFAVIPMIKLVYQIIMESSAKQATYGKQILNIKVCDMQGERISPGRAIARNLAKLVSVSTLFIGYLLSFFSKQQQCLHDMIAGTLVMKDRLF
ncbi:RDD family protein [Mucilaginibacter sp. BJC16-A38]|uniref:RDD family protein n=1 Tax=Mucilaginibacter phenanthrenivorans TaxID=1234842 RepID=UPI00215780DA|nr:RDD family protein [Mucilaginibacter phenanthrenivorans]MCR8558747.1 RDD family protein [Mucilaginibacter phenanthrenivorans]